MHHLSLITALIFFWSIFFSNSSCMNAFARASAPSRFIEDHITRQKNMGTKPNNLINEKSPYLLQHAFNPVNWYPWGEEAMAKAKEEDKPIFLSIGYSTCHWCHVMAHESFEDAEIAAILNLWFICIKVDREERPDIDQLYMAAVQAMTGKGGWPMSVFLTPEGKPFFGGTYFPPKSVQGLPGFGELLGIINRAWQTKRDEVEGNSEQLFQHISSNSMVDAPASVSKEILDSGYEKLAASYDDRYGGFGQAPKFPRPVVFNFLLRYSQRNNHQRAKEMVLQTLRKMAAGGMYDQLGGGFHRYSVDGQWRVPHFEKMLYDQAQLAHSYLDAFQITRDPFFAGIAREIFEYVLRDMTDPLGGFYSAEDADSPLPENPGEQAEGAFYTWSEEEIVRIIGAKDANIFNLCYGIEFDGNALSDPQDEFKGKNILFRAKSNQQAAEQLKIDPTEVEKALKRAGQKLFDQRTTRPRPHLDDKVITAWNGLMIGAFARGSRVLGQKKYLTAAVRAASFLRDQLYNGKTKTLMRRYRDGEAGLKAHLDDYTFVVSGLLELYQATGELQWLSWAKDLTASQIRLFQDSKGGFFDTAEDNTVPVRMKSNHDGAEPAGNSVAVMNLLRLATILDQKQWQRLAEQTVKIFGAGLQRYPPAMPQMLAAVDQLFSNHRQVVIAGKPGPKIQKHLSAQYIPPINQG